MNAQTIAVVCSEDHDRVLVKAFLLQGLEHTPELLVHAGYHTKIVFDMLAIIVAHLRTCRRDIGPAAELFELVVLVLRHVFGRDLSVGRMRRVEGHGQCKGFLPVTVLPAAVAHEGNGLVRLVLRTPLVHLERLVARGVAFPVMRMQVVIKAAVRVPEVESMPPLRRTPRVPHQPAARRLHIGLARGVQVPLADISAAVSARFEHIRPAGLIRRELNAVFCAAAVAVGQQAIGMRVFAAHEHAAERAAHRVI